MPKITIVIIGDINAETINGHNSTQNNINSEKESEAQKAHIADLQKQLDEKQRTIDSLLTR